MSKKRAKSASIPRENQSRIKNRTKVSTEGIDFVCKLC